MSLFFYQLIDYTTASKVIVYFATLSKCGEVLMIFATNVNLKRLTGPE